MTNAEIHNIWLHMSGKSEGLLEAGGNADFPVLFANAILEYTKRKWVGLTDQEIEAIGKPYEQKDRSMQAWGLFACAIEAKLKELNT